MNTAWKMGIKKGAGALCSPSMSANRNHHEARTADISVKGLSCYLINGKDGVSEGRVAFPLPHLDSGWPYKNSSTKYLSIKLTSLLNN